MQFEAIIFDMDGVLFDTEHFYYERRKTFLESKGISIDHLPPAYFIGGNMKQVWVAILRDDYDQYDVPRLQEEYTAYKDSHPLPYCDLIFSDVKETLEKLAEKGIKIGIASSSTKSDILRALEENDIMEYFQVIRSGHEFKESKPDPAIYLASAEELGVDKDKILIIEDSTKGIQAGVSAGIEVWGIEDLRFGLDQSKADRLVSSLTDAMTLIGV